MSLPKASKEADVLKDKKKNARLATKAAVKNKIEKEAKRLADKSAMEMASELPAGQGNTFIKLHTEHQKAENAIAAANKVKRAVRAEMKAIKIDMSAYDRVNKLSKMDPEDVRAKKTTEDLYEQQLSMELTDAQKDRIAEINRKREDARKAMVDISGGAAGKEVGSAAAAGDEAEEDEADGEPQRNESLTPRLVGVDLAAGPAH